MKIWLRILLAVLGICALLMAAASSPWMVITVGAVAGLALIAEAALMWWSLVAPFLVATALPLAFALTARQGQIRVPGGLTSVRTSAAPVGATNTLQPSVPVAAGTPDLGTIAAQLPCSLLPHS
jgi:hypothetical protein